MKNYWDWSKDQRQVGLPTYKAREALNDLYDERIKKLKLKDLNKAIDTKDQS